jgi:hypothetical protein
MVNLMSDHRYQVAVLLPTRARTDALDRSLRSLVDLAQDLRRVQFLLGFDRDDEAGKTYFMNHIRPWMVERGINYQALVFEPLGYAQLNEYVNRLAARSDSDWLFFWNDDAVMQTQDWDELIVQHTGQFRLLSVRTHHDHPYSIFPIVPREWFDVLDGCLSPHNLTDAWLSQQAYMLDNFQRIDIHVLHDRFDLTGNNNDSTYQEREVFEGNPNNPRDFHHVSQEQRRMVDTERLAQYMRSRGIDTTWWDNVRSGTQDPWQRLKENDTNGQMMQFKRDSNGQPVANTSNQLYDFEYFYKADGIASWRSRSLKFGDAMAGLGYAHGITWDELVAAWPQVFEHDANGRGESVNQSLVHQQMSWLNSAARRRPRRVLEIGGGRGEVATVLKHMGIDVVSVEMGAGAARWYSVTAYHYFGKSLEPVIPVNQPIQEALEELDLSTFDTILMVESLEHIPQEAFDPVWLAIRQQFRGRFIVVNWPDYHPIWVGRDASPQEHCRLVDDALYDDWSQQAHSVWTRRGSHLVLDF